MASGYYGTRMPPPRPTRFTPLAANLFDALRRSVHELNRSVQLVLGGLELLAVLAGGLVLQGVRVGGERGRAHGGNKSGAWCYMGTA